MARWLGVSDARRGDCALQVSAHGSLESFTTVLKRLMRRLPCELLVSEALKLQLPLPSELDAAASAAASPRRAGEGAHVAGGAAGGCVLRSLNEASQTCSSAPSEISILCPVDREDFTAYEVSYITDLISLDYFRVSARLSGPPAPPAAPALRSRQPPRPPLPPAAPPRPAAGR